MKSKQINKFLLMFFFCFTLFFSVSYAGWTEIPNTTQSKQDSSTAESIAGYTLSQIRSFFTADVSNRNTMLDAVKSAGYYVLWVPVKDDLSSYYTYVFPISNNVDFGGYTAGLDTSPFYFYTYIEEGYQYYIRNTSSSSSGSKMTCTGSGYIVIGGSNGFKNSTFNSLIAQDPLKFGNLPYLKKISSNSGYYWDGTSYYWEGSSEPEVPSISDDELANIINVFLNSEDFKTYALSGYKDFFVVYNSVAEQYYAYLYKSTLDLGMNYGEFDEEGKFDVTGLSEGEGYRIFWHTGAEGFLEQLWSNVSKLLTPAKYLTFRINPENEKCHYITTYEDKQMIFTTSQQHIVYSSKDITLYVRDGENVIIDVPNSIGKTTLVDSSTNEEYEFVIPETSVSETPWNRFLTIISEIPSNIIKKISEMNGFTVIVNLVSPLLAAIIAIIAVFGSVISLISRAVTFIYTLPTIEPSRALFDVDVAATEGLSFSGNNWGIKFLEGLDMIRNFSWNGLNLWNLFVSFIVAMFAIQVIKYVRKHYHY